MAYPEEEIRRDIQNTERYLGILSQVGRLIATSPNMTPAYGEDDYVPYGTTATSTRQSGGEPLVELFLYSYFPSENTLAHYRVAIEPTEYANFCLPGQKVGSIPSRRVYYIQKDGRIEFMEQKYSTDEYEDDEAWVDANVVEDLSLAERRNLEEELKRLTRIE